MKNYNPLLKCSAVLEPKHLPEYILLDYSGQFEVVTRTDERTQNVLTTPDNSRAYIANTGTNFITVLDTAANEVIAALPTGEFPVDIAITPILLF